MASILRVNTLTDASSNNSVATSVIFNGTAKAWIFTNQASAVDSYNMSATTDHGTGHYTNSITSDFSSANWLISHEAGLEGETYGLYLEDSSVAKTAGAIKFKTNSNGNVVQDASKIQQICFGDLA